MTIKNESNKICSMTCCPAALLSLCTGLAPALGGLCRCWRRNRVFSWSRSSSCRSRRNDALCCVRGSEMSDVCQSCNCLCCSRPAETPLTAQHLTKPHSMLNKWTYISCNEPKTATYFVWVLHIMYGDKHLNKTDYQKKKRMQGLWYKWKQIWIRVCGL